MLFSKQNILRASWKKADMGERYRMKMTGTVNHHYSTQNKLYQANGWTGLVLWNVVLTNK